MKNLDQAHNYINDVTEKNLDRVFSLVQDLYDHPEVGGQEVHAHQVLTDYLENLGFSIERNLVMDTAFRASYQGQTPKSGPTIALMAEYDALPGIGHGCGHNLIQGFSLLAATALKDLIDETGGILQVLGTPAEENFGGKVHMAEAGLFDTVDAALMIHPSTKNGLGALSSALYPLKFEFFGKTAHGCKPQEGASALDAAVMTYTAIQFQRQFMGKDCFIHGIIKNGGEAANVIPGYASLEYYFRAPTMKEAQAMAEDATKRAQAMADATGTTMKTSVYECPYGDTLPSISLAEYMREAMTAEGIEDIEDFDWTIGGSTDVGAVSYKCPTLQANLKIAESDVLGHSVEMAQATVSDVGKKALLDGARTLAKVSYKLLTDPEALEACRSEQKERLEKVNN